MIPPGTAREALLIEALGEMSGVLDRVESLVHALKTAERGTVEAHGKLAAQLPTLEAHIAATAKAATTHAVNLIAQRTTQSTRQSIDEHLRAMEEAARSLLLKELGPLLQALTQPLLRLQQVVRDNARPWDAWLTHAATAAAASMCTWLVMSGVWKP